MAAESPPLPAAGHLRTAVAALVMVVVAATQVLEVVCHHLGETVLSPGFYSQELAQSGAYQALAERFVPAAVDDRLRRAFPDVSQQVVDEAAELARDTFPEAWFASLTDSVAEQGIDYLSRRSEHLVARVTIGDRLQAASAAVQSRLPNSIVAREVYERATERVVDEVMERHPVLPFGLRVARGTWLEAVRLAASREWVVAEVADQISHCFDYLRGEVLTLNVTIPLWERQQQAAAAIELVVHESHTLVFVRDRIVRPVLAENLEPKVLLPEVGVRLEKEELIAAFDAVLDSAWVEERERDIVTSAAAYLAGASDRLELQVPLAPLKVLATERLTAAVDDKVMAYFETLPVCTQRELARRVMGQAVGPLCHPQGLSYYATKMVLGVNVRSQVRRELDARVPDRWVYSEDRTRDTVGPDTWRLVQDVRRWMRHGVRIEEPELRALLRRDQEDILERVLKVTREGFVFTDGEVRARVEQLGGEAALARVDAARDWLALSSRARGPLLGLWLVGLVVLALVGGPGPWRRLSWLGGALALGGVGTLLTAWVSEATMLAQLDGLAERAAALATSSAVDVLAAAAPEVLDHMVEAFVGGLVAFGGSSVGVGGFLLVMGLAGRRLRVLAMRSLRRG